MVNTQPPVPPTLQSATTSAQNANTNLSQAMAAAHHQQHQQQTQQNTQQSGQHQQHQQQTQQNAQQSGQQSQQGNSSQSQHLPTAADIQLMISLGLGLNPSDASQLANWDLQKLAMLLVSRCHHFYFVEIIVQLCVVDDYKYRVDCCR